MQKNTFNETHSPFFLRKMLTHLSLVIRCTSYVLLPLVWQEIICDLFLSIQLISSISWAISVINTISMSKQNVCKSSTVIYKQPHKSSITVNKQRSFWCARNMASIYDTGCSICLCFLSKDPFRM